ncbi:hypothetical protein HDE_09791 [Halotydeus destructor]|nr:hypothetical protein HDE_09791 [Halotydeus destructor]
MKIRWDKHRKLINIILRLASVDGYNSLDQIKLPDGTYMSGTDVVKLTLHAVSPGSLMNGVEEFVNLLYYAGVEPNMVVNSEIQNMLKSLYDRKAARTHWKRTSRSTVDQSTQARSTQSSETQTDRPARGNSETQTVNHPMTDAGTQMEKSASSTQTDQPRLAHASTGVDGKTFSDATTETLISEDKDTQTAKPATKDMSTSNEFVFPSASSQTTPRETTEASTSTTRSKSTATDPLEKTTVPVPEQNDVEVREGLEPATIELPPNIPDQRVIAEKRKNTEDDIVDKRRKLDYTVPEDAMNRWEDTDSGDENSSAKPTHRDAMAAWDNDDSDDNARKRKSDRVSKYQPKRRRLEQWEDSDSDDDGPPALSGPFRRPARTARQSMPKLLKPDEAHLFLKDEK